MLTKLFRDFHDEEVVRYRADVLYVGFVSVGKFFMEGRIPRFFGIVRGHGGTHWINDGLMAIFCWWGSAAGT